MVPLSEPFIDRHGVKRHGFGQVISLVRLALGLLKQHKRWEVIPEAVKAIPGVFSNLLTFAAGAHACIGYPLFNYRASHPCRPRALAIPLSLPSRQDESAPIFSRSVVRL